MRKPIVGLCAALLAVTGWACGEPGGGGSAGVNALAAAADKATNAGTARMTMSMEISSAGQSLGLEAEGAMDFDEKIGKMSVIMTGEGLGGPQTIDTVFEDQYVYTKIPEGLPGAPTTGWVRIDLSSMPGVGAGGANQFAQDPSQFLEYLRGAGENVEEVGTEEVRGVPTTHYKADLVFEKMLDQAPDQQAVDELRAQLDSLGGLDSIPCEAWIDESGLPRRMTMAMSVEAGGQTTEMDISMDLFDYGVDVNIQPPKKFEEITPPAG